MVRRLRGVHALSLIEIKKKLLMAQKGGADVSELFNTSLWTGTSAARTITTGVDSGEGSLVWIKNRGATVNHTLFDTIRGALNYLSTNLINASTTQAGSLVGFDSSGYSLGTHSLTNTSTALYVGWQFRRAEKFFNIVQYTGTGTTQTIPHSLGITPGIIVTKRVNNTSDWPLYHRSLGSSSTVYLDLTNASAIVGFWGSTDPTDTGFTVSSSNVGVNAVGGQYIAYLFAHDPSPEGLIQCGSYVGNGSATGPVVNLGWRPQYLMIKSATGASNWTIVDAVRGLALGGVTRNLLANESDVESTTALYSNSSGFQIGSNTSQINSNNQTYIYMAIREAA